MNQTKLTAELTQQLQRTEDSEMMDVVIEVEPENSAPESFAYQSLSRQERITALQENFAKQSAPVEDAIEQAGGEVLDRAWINQTLKVRVPVESIPKISEHENIYTVDVLHSIEKD
jgi:hypothetical protein